MMTHIVTPSRTYEETTAILSPAFDRVANKENWKFAIDAVIDIADMDEQLVIHEAVIFYTGSVPTFTHLTGHSFRVRARGYYAAIGS
jgi:hypothetical protein